jgi:hypothetical protein
MNSNVAESEYFCLFILTFAFICLLLIIGLNDHKAKHELFVSHDLPFASVRWPYYSFGIFSVLLVIISGLTIATVRSYYLQKHNLLQGWAKNSYFIYFNINLTIFLAILTEIIIIFTGLLIYGFTQSSAILTSSIFLPVILVSLYYLYVIWKKNDYELVVWPPILVVGDVKDIDIVETVQQIEEVF